MQIEPFNGPQWPTHRIYVHPFDGRSKPLRVELVVFYENGEPQGRTLGWYGCPDEARRDASVHRKALGRTGHVFLGRQ